MQNHITKYFIHIYIGKIKLLLIYYEIYYVIKYFIIMYK